jgi:hypothetical protein
MDDIQTLTTDVLIKRYARIYKDWFLFVTVKVFTPNKQGWITHYTLNIPLINRLSFMCRHNVFHL